MTNACSAVPRLPIEVIERVIDSVYELVYTNDNFYARDRHHIWRSCALSCRTMLPRSQYWLFRHITLTKQVPAENLMNILRVNPQVARHTRVLSIWGHRGHENQEQRQRNTWISWIPLLLAPRMTNLKELYLSYAIFSGTHPSLPMALTAFKYIQRLELYFVSFSTFGHSARLIRAYPHLHHLSYAYNSWNPKPQIPYNPSSKLTSRRRLPIVHLDLGSRRADGLDLPNLIEWFVENRDQNLPLRTLSLVAENNDLIPNILLRCGPPTCSVFLMIYSDSPILDDHACLHIIHLRTFDDVFPVLAVTSLIRFSTSPQLLKLVVYMDVTHWQSEEGSDASMKKKTISVPYAALDTALCNPVLKQLKLTLCLCGPESADAVIPWQQTLSAQLPKFDATEGRLKVESTRTKYPSVRWVDLRDGF